MCCQDCDYVLWNIKARECPECGTPFTPSAYEFVANGVRFCCPDCDQEYYGTDRRGHLVPRGFDVRCGRGLDMDEMVLRPAEGVSEEATRADRFPWLDAGGKWRIGAWLSTIGRAMVDPTRLMRALPTGATSGRAWLFVIVTWLFILSCSLGIPMVGFGLINMMGGGGGGDSIAMAVWFVAAGLVAILLLILLWGLAAHGILLLTGGAPHPLRRTMQAICYSSGANITSAVPCLGVYFSFVGALWWMVSAVQMMSEGQRVTGGRATLAVLAFPVGGMLLGGVGVMGLAVYGMSNAQQLVATAMSAQQDAEATIVLQPLIDEAAAAGRWPGHVLELRGDTVGSFDFLASDSETYDDDVAVGDIDLAGFAELGEGRQKETLESLEALPDGVVAHRFGDFVFTYHGVDPTAPPGGVWLLVLSPDPEVNDMLAFFPVTVGRADGVVESIVPGDLEARLDEQNALRASIGLSPLPPPSEVTQGNPWVP